VSEKVTDIFCYLNVLMDLCISSGHHAANPGTNCRGQGDINLNRLTLDTIQTFPLFRELADAELAAILLDFKVQQFGAGELVIGHTDPSFDVLLLVQGSARASLYSADGQHVGFHDMPAGTMFGEIAAIDGLPRSASVEAGEACIIARLPRKRFLALIESNPAFALAVTRQLAGHIRRLTTRVFEFSTMAVRQRLRAELLRLAKPSQASSDAAAIASLPTHAELASRISTHREAVSREMAWLESQGLTAKQGRNLIIPSLAKFRSLLDQSWEG